MGLSHFIETCAKYPDAAGAFGAFSCLALVIVGISAYHIVSAWRTPDEINHYHYNDDPE